jgi:benzil reductase ((S)-benzoin forming)
MMPENVVWVTGATSGLGYELSRRVPIDNARVISIARRPHPDLESVNMDLLDLDSVTAVVDHFAEVLHMFTGERAILVHNAHYSDEIGLVGECDPNDNGRSLAANVVGSLKLAEGFIRATIEHGAPSTEFGLVMLSSAAAEFATEGMAAYCATKAAIEQWVRVVRRERERRGADTWVTAVRPGLVNTPFLARQADADAARFPLSRVVQQWVSDGADVWDAAESADAIWSRVLDASARTDVIDLTRSADISGSRR